MIKIKIDVTKIDKERLYKGEKGTYLNAVMIETPENDYGDYVIIEEISKEEREQGDKGNILGNGKLFVKKQETKSPKENKSSDNFNDVDDLTF
jgi:hypothetical protein